MGNRTIGQCAAAALMLVALSSCHRLRHGGATPTAGSQLGPTPGGYPTVGQPWAYGTPAPAAWPPATAGGHLGYATAPGMQAAAFAQSVQGRPYCWGGTGPECFDCSGLTYAAWQAAGTTIPRTSAAQRDELSPVAWSALQPGDILWRPGHVGIYVGNGWVVHAPRKGETVGLQPARAYREAHRP